MSEQTIAAWEGCRDDPVRFARTSLRLEPTDQQCEFLSALAQPGARVAVRSGHGTGKSTALAAAALWFVATRPDGLAPCTAPTGHQLQDVLWREMRRLLANMSGDERAVFSATADKIQRKDATGMIVARTARPENPDALQGFHAPEILFIIDEAAGVNNAVFEVARGALSTPSARVALAGNPTRLTGYFHAAFNMARASWTRLHFSCLDSPLVSPEYPAEMAREYGDDSDVYRIRVLGDFPRTGMFNLISYEAVEKAMSIVQPSTASLDAPVIFGIDPAWMGPDRSAGVLRQGMSARVLFTLRGADTTRLADLVARKADEYDPDAIFVDQTGVGAGVADQLRRTRYPVTGIAFSQTPLEPERFVNRRAEMWWRLREWLEQGPALEANTDLRDDLIAPEYCLTPGGKILLEAKSEMRKRGLASPDLGDALALTFAMPVRPKMRHHHPAGEELPKYNGYDWMERK